MHAIILNTASPGLFDRNVGSNIKYSDCCPNLFDLSGRTCRLFSTFIEILSFHCKILQCTIADDSFYLGILFSTSDKFLHIIELAVDFLRNLSNNALHKEIRYHPHLADLAIIEFVNPCFSCLVYLNTSDLFFQMLIVK